MIPMSTQGVVFLTLSVYGLCGSASTSRNADGASAEVESTFRSPEPHTHRTIVAAAPPAVGASKTVYLCPMHADVVVDGPGLCPKCNMKLDPKPHVSLLRPRTAHEMWQWA